MDEHLTPEERLKSARDWAASVQTRFAERLAGGMARRLGEGATPALRRHLQPLRKAAEQVGLDPNDLDSIERPSRKISEFDEPRTRQNIEARVEEVLGTMGALDLSIGNRQLLVSSVPSGLVNAFCCSSTWDVEHHHVFVDSDLVVFCASLAKIVATCFTRGNLRNGRIDLGAARVIRTASDRDVVGRIKDLYAAPIFAGTVRASEPWMPEGAALAQAALLTLAMERFFVAHELAHLMLGHLDNAAESVRVADEAFADAAATVFSHQAELEADAAGAVLALETGASHGASDALSAIAPFVFLKGIEVMEACDQEAGRPRKTNSTHPPAAERARSVRTILLRRTPERDQPGDVPQALKKLDQVFVWIRNHALAGIRQSVEYGLVPHERVSLRMIELAERPGILGLRVDPGRVESVGKELARRVETVHPGSSARQGR